MGFCRLCFRSAELRYQVCAACIDYVAGEPLEEGGGTLLWDVRLPSIQWIVTDVALGGDGQPYKFRDARADVPLVELDRLER